MGVKLFVKDGVFWPNDYGLYEGDQIDIVLVAGGCSGGQGYTHGAYSKGEDSAFGTYAIAYSGQGAPGMRQTYLDGNRYGGAGGAGGFVPGAPFQGGAGIMSPSAPDIFIMLPNTNAGGASSIFRDVSPTKYSFVSGANGDCFGGGASSEYTSAAGSNGFGGAGYGAGGGTMGSSNSSNSFSGSAGQILYYTHVITASDCTNGIPVTIGAGRNRWNDYVQFIGLNRAASKNVRDAKPLCQPAAIGVYGCYKTFELSDGTYGLAPSSNTSTGYRPNSTNYVKVKGVNKVFSFDAIFKGFSNSLSYPIYVCGKYYCGIIGDTTKTSIHWVDREKAAAGTLTSSDYGVVEIPHTTTGSYSMAGFQNNCLVIFSSNNGSTYRLYTNWTPTTTSYTTKTCSTPIFYQSVSNMNLMPYGDYSLVPMYSAMSETHTEHSSKTILHNYSSAATISLVYERYCTCYCTHSKVMRYNYYDAAADYRGYGEADFTTSQRTTPNSHQLSFYLGGDTPVAFTSTSQQSYRWYPTVFWPTEDDGFAFISQSNYPNYTEANIYFPKYAQIWGWDNNPGCPDGGGAGGCCMITW